MFHLHAATTLDLSITPTPWPFFNFPIKQGFFFCFNFCCEQHFLRIAALIQSAEGRKKRPHPSRACLAPSPSDPSEMLSDQGFNGWGRTLFLSIISDLSFRPRSVLMPYRWGTVSRQVALCHYVDFRLCPLQSWLVCRLLLPSPALAGVKQQLANK